MRGVWGAWLIGAAAMVLGTLAAVPVLCRGLFAREVLAGWAVSLASGVAGTWLHRRAMRGGSSGFFLWGVFASILRLLVVVGIVAVYRRLGAGNLLAFAVTVVAGYLSFTAAEVGLLYRMAAGGGEQRE